MKNSPRLASLDVSTSTIDLSPDIDAYLARLTREQNHFLRAIADAGAMIPADLAHLGHVAAIQGRLTQEFLDAQRAILRRRAETHAIVSEIATSAEAECVHLIAEPTVATPYVAATSAAPTRNAITTDDGDLASIALLVDAAFSATEPDGSAMKRQLREVLDEWWRFEIQESQAVVDDATARAAMRVHTAKVEAEVIADAAQFGQEPVDPPFVYEEPKHLSPLVAALDIANHEDLDQVLTSLLDDLDRVVDDTCAVGTAASPEVTEPAAVADTSSHFRPTLPPPSIGSFEIRLPAADADALNDRSAAPGEAFDRFWGSFAARGSGGRDWVSAQILLPCVAVVAVLAFVLAVVG